jgi:hypothetical protein
MKSPVATVCVVGGAVLLTAVIAQAFTIGTKHQILEDAINLSPASLKEYLEPKHDQLATAVYQQNKIFHRYKLNRQMWKKNIIGNFNTLRERLRDKKDEYNTFIHFANLLDASCNYIQYGNESQAIRASTFFCPSRVTYDGYQRIEDVDAFILEIDKAINWRSECTHDDPCYNEQYILAVNTILDLWVTAWELSGYDVSSQDQNAFLVHDKTEFDADAGGPISVSSKILDRSLSKSNGIGKSSGISAMGAVDFPPVHRGDFDPDISHGAIDPNTGQFYPDVGGGFLDTYTGTVYPKVGGGAINPNTGEFYPIH